MEDSPEPGARGGSAGPADDTTAPAPTSPGGVDPRRVTGSRWQVQVRGSTPSTNSDARELVAAGAPAGTVVTTLDQTAGRGRLTRRWVTPPGAALSTSVVLAPPAQVPDQRWPWLSLLTGLAVRDALAGLGVDARVKWPNDVLVGDLKVAGILVERAEGPGGHGQPGGSRAVVGVGLNVAAGADDLPPTGTSLALQGATPDASVVLDALLQALGARYDAWVALDGDPAAGDGRLLEDYRAACATVGTDVRVHLPREAVLEGRCVDVDAEGHLVVQAAGHRHRLGVGDVVHVRAGGAAGRRPEE